MLGVGGATVVAPRAIAGSSSDVVPLVQLAVAAGAAVVVLQCGFLARLLDDRRLTSVAIAWAYYGLVSLPLSVVHDATASVPLRGAWLAGQLMFLALLASGLRPGRSPLLVGALAVLLTGVLVAAATRLPASATAVLATRLPDEIALACSTVLAGAYAVRGVLRAAPVWWRLGFGIGIEAAACFGEPTGAGPALALLGFLVLIVGLGLGVRDANGRLRLQRAEQAERAAASERSRASRDHEIRNALSNLAAITILAGEEPGDVAETVTGELARLRDLLDGRADGDDRCAAPVDLVLRRLVLLRRAAGCEIALDCAVELNAAFPTDVLTEVLTNLLANCERHAPGAPVRIEARRVDGRCRIDVSDSGPGLVPDHRGRRRGSGLGLALSSQLMISNGGRLRLLPAARPGGCTVRLDVPLANGQPLPRRYAHPERDAS